MAEFRTPVITNIGLNIINKALSGEVIEFSSVKTGAGNYTGSEDLKEATDLLNFKNSFNVSAVSVEGNTLKINTVINNNGVNVGYHIKEVGIYATVGKQEKLLAIVTAANPDFLAEQASAPVTIVIEFHLTIDRANEIKFSYSVPEGIYIDVGTFETRLSNFENSINEKLAKMRTLQIKAASFTNQGPYTQRIDVAEIKSTDVPEIALLIPDRVTDSARVKAIKKAWSCVDRIDTYDGYIVISCFVKKPETDILLLMKGV